LPVISGNPLTFSLNMSDKTTVEHSPNDDCVYPRDQVAHMLSTAELAKGVIPSKEDAMMFGALPSAEKTKAKKPAAKSPPPKTSEPKPASIQAPSHTRSLSTDSEKALYNMELRTELLKVKSEVNDLQEIIAKQGQLLSKINKQSDETRELLDKLLKVHDNDMKGIRATLDAHQSDTRKRIDETLQIHRETPVIVERLIKQSNELLTYLPEEQKAGLKAVKLQPQEKKALDTVRQHTKLSKKDIPKHLRDFM
jgi:vacuolar-type H+-ATPase subunit I/STV1